MSPVGTPALAHCSRGVRSAPRTVDSPGTGVYHGGNYPWQSLRQETPAVGRRLCGVRPISSCRSETVWRSCTAALLAGPYTHVGRMISVPP